MRVRLWEKGNQPDRVNRGGSWDYDILAFFRAAFYLDEGRAAYAYNNLSLRLVRRFK